MDGSQMLTRDEARKFVKALPPDQRAALTRLYQAALRHGQQLQEVEEAPQDKTSLTHLLVRMLRPRSDAGYVRVGVSTKPSKAARIDEAGGGLRAVA